LCGWDPREGSARKNGRALQVFDDIAMSLEIIGGHEDRLEDMECFGNKREMAAINRP
jgi:hypothetical protein